MTVYTVHRQQAGSAEDVILVPDGFSVWALVAGPLWAFFNRMWLVGAGLVAFDILLAAAATTYGLNTAVAGALELAVAFLFACECQDLRRVFLAAKGWMEIAVVTGENREEAELSYVLGAARQNKTPASPEAAVPSYLAHDTLGLFGNV